MRYVSFIILMILSSFVYAQYDAHTEVFRSDFEEYKLTNEGLILEKITGYAPRSDNSNMKIEKEKVGDCFCRSDYIIIKDISHAKCPYSSTFCKQVEGESRRLSNWLILHEKTKYILPIMILMGLIFYYLYKKTGPTKP